MCIIAPPGHEVYPPPERESISRTVFAGWLSFGGIFQLFWQKMHPRQNPGYAYGPAVAFRFVCMCPAAFDHSVDLHELTPLSITCSKLSPSPDVVPN